MMIRMLANAILVLNFGLSVGAAIPDETVGVSSNVMVPPQIHPFTDFKLSLPSGSGSTNSLTLAPRIVHQTNSTSWCLSTPSATHFSLHVLKPDASRHYCLNIAKPDEKTNYVIEFFR